ncbi:MAG TPA: ATP-binding protein [Candidatus Aminicenantes bacterium]|nr:ATP-binding protein [Candidatus Aminicenantes bacterium]
MPRPHDTVNLNFSSNLKYTEFSVLVMEYLGNLLQISDERFFQIEIALREVINNAIVHGNRSDPEKRVNVSFSWNSEYLRIRIRDENPEDVDFERLVREAEQKDVLSPSGRGMLLMQSYMDSLSFESTTEGSVITMEKRL